MDSMIICEFQCETCRRPMHIPLHTILQEFEHQDRRPKDIPCIALVCSQCKTVGNQSRASLGARAVGETGPSWEVVEWLPCEAETCQFPLGVFAQWSASTTLEERQKDVKSWRWRPLVCEAGNPVPKPREIYAVPLT
jgi:hypothetical protein